jgi:hypothetical protein
LDPQGAVKDLKKLSKWQTEYFEMIVERHRRARRINRASETLTGDTKASFTSFVDLLLDFQEEGTPFYSSGEISFLSHILYAFSDCLHCPISSCQGSGGSFLAGREVLSFHFSYQAVHHYRPESRGIMIDASLTNLIVFFTESGERRLSDKGLMGLLLSMWMAGIDTTASQTEWVFLELLRHPDLLQRLQDEIDGVVGKDRPVQEADLQAVPILKSVVLEAVRLHPIASTGFPHVNTKSSTLGKQHDFLELLMQICNKTFT